jgi:hypothetical protein
VAMEIVIADHGHTGQVISIMDKGDVRAAVSNSIVTYGSDSEAQAEDSPLCKPTRIRARSEHSRASLESMLVSNK